MKVNVVLGRYMSNLYSSPMKHVHIQNLGFSLNPCFKTHLCALVTTNHRGRWGSNSRHIDERHCHARLCAVTIAALRCTLYEKNIDIFA